MSEAAGGAGRRPVLPRYAPWLAFALGALQSFAFAPLALWPLGVGCLAALFWLWLVAPARAGLTGFAFGAGLFAAGTYWLYNSIHVLGRAPLAVAFVLMLGLVAIMGSYSALVGWLIGRFGPHRLAPRLLGASAGLWVLMEWFRGWFLSGFPWLALGYSVIDTPLAGYAPVIGVYGVSLAAALTAGLLVMVAVARTPARLAAAIAVIFGVGAALGGVRWTHPSGPPLTVGIVQGAIPQDLKWQEDNRERTLEVYRTLTQQVLGQRIIIWPEAALPLLYHEAVPYLTALYREAAAKGSDLVLGLLRYDFDRGEYQNGLVALGADEEWYYKRRLVPFGEFFPVPGFVRAWMRLKSLTYVDLAPGAERQPPLSAGGQKLGATICYEDAYAVEQLAVLKDATLLVNVSNDAWFGDSSAPHQHLDITRMRALEAGRWMMRGTNNGISALIDPRGRVVARTRQFVPEVLKGSVVPYTGLTPYARLRNWPALGGALALVLVAAWCARSGRRRAPG